jgi:glycolate oxidase FAD binding subunit
MRSALAHVEGLSQIAGRDAVRTGPAGCARFTVDGFTPAAVVEPGSVEQVCEILRWARAERAALLPVGSGNLLGIGAIPARLDVALSLARLDSLLRYDPGDLTFSVQAGMPLERLQQSLAEHNQFLPVNPPGGAEACLGGLVATNASGPWRYAYGSWRDFVLGMRFVTGTGKVVKTGGRVVKNVAGYDLGKLLIGSLGTLGIIVEINFKAFPRPAEQVTWVAGFADLHAALALRSAVVHSPLQPMAIELLDASAARLLQLPDSLQATPWTLAVEAGGVPPVLQRYDAELAQRARAAGAVSFARLTVETNSFWARVADFARTASAASSAVTVLKASLLLSQMEDFLVQADAIAGHLALRTATVARAGSGIVSLALLPEPGLQDPVEQVVHAIDELAESASVLGGRVVVERAPTDLKRRVNVWGGTGEALALMQGLKREFDPDGILNPGRFLNGI